MKTIKELADSLKVSKVSLYNAVKRDDIKKHTFKQDNATVVDETGESLLIALFNKENSDSILSDIKADSKDLKQGNNHDLMRELLQEKDAQINLLLNQLNEKDNQINTLQRLLENQQKLQIPLLTDGREKGGLLDRLFRRKN